MLHPPYNFPVVRKNAPAQPVSLPISPSRPAPTRSRKRPRGIWKTRRPAAAQAFVNHLTTHAASLRHHHHHRVPAGNPDSSDLDNEESDAYEDEEDDVRSVSTASSSKRRKLDSSSLSAPSSPEDPTPSSSSVHSDQSIPLPVSTPSSPSFYESSPERPSMDSLLTVVASKTDKRVCEYSDWEELKDLFAEAAERYERDEAASASKLLRAVIQECNRFMSIHPDPSILFSFDSRKSHAPTTPTAGDYFSYGFRLAPSKPKFTELPTAFHAVLGIALFLFGNLIDQDSSVLDPDEPTAPTVYWLSALDVFETGENLPCRTSGMSDAEDWRMAIVWGRALVCLAETKIELLRADPSSRLPVDEPKWPRDSIFRAIASTRPPVTRRRSLATASPNDLMVLAMDQFSRGILHMPHPHYTHDAPSPAVAAFAVPSSGTPITLPQTLTPATHASLGFSRPKELFTIASEVLVVAERLSVLAERRYWALWADAVLEQMKMEAADVGVFWRGRIAASRGRCWLVAGSVGVDEIEDALARGEEGVLDRKDASEARDAFRKAVGFFERARASGFDLTGSQPLFCEALLSLANLTQDENTREELYARAESEGADLSVEGDVVMDES